MTVKTPKSSYSTARKALIASVATFGIVAVLATGSIVGLPGVGNAQTAATPVISPPSAAGSASRAWLHNRS